MSSLDFWLASQMATLWGSYPLFDRIIQTLIRHNVLGGIWYGMALFVFWARGRSSDLPAIFPSCYCGVIPSTGWDSFTYSSIEMAASGLPVVASRLQGLSESVLHERTGLLFEPANSRELAGCLERLLNSPQLAAQYGQEGRRRCERELNTVTQRQRFLEVVGKRLNAWPAAAAPPRGGSNRLG
jgi:glycosyltransferase involved in cell wall biosynthesis